MGPRPGGGGIGNAPGAAYPGRPAGPTGGRPRCASSSCPRSCRHRSSRLSRCTPNGTVPAANRGHRARCKPRLNGRRVVRVGIAGQHLPQADVDEVVPSVVPGRTVRVHARLERRIRVRPVSDEIRHRVYQAPGTSPEGWQLRGIGGDR